MSTSAAAASTASATWVEPIPHHKVRGRAGLTLGAMLGFYVVVAYLMMPAEWRLYAHRHPKLDDLTTIVYTKSGIPGDPLNVGLIGTEAEIKKLFHDAGWHAADPLSIRADLKIAEATVLDKSYAAAPVSSLYYDGKKEDLAFELQIGHDPKRRNHVRYWKTKKVDTDGRPIWLGSATLDVRVGLSGTTGQITHHIGADVDAERDTLMKSLDKTGELVDEYPIKNFHKTLEGRNGGGDKWHTDGTLMMGVIRPGN